MIPSFVDESTPPGESDVFTMLAGGPDDWVALHSLDLAPWNRGLRTEIDFVVLVPDLGILCVEVKSQRDITFQDDRWSPPEIRRSPFKQACDGQHAFYRKLKYIAPRFKHVPVVHCCVFPNASFDVSPNLSVQPWELIDARRFRSFSSAVQFCRALSENFRASIESDANLSPLAIPLSREQVESMIAFCLPVQKRRPDAREEIIRREQEIERILRTQQKPILQLATSNERVVVNGGAGTGKTLIALEIARRAAESGRRVGLLCFNQLVGEWMKQRVAKTTPPLPNLTVGRAIQTMAELAGLEMPANPDRQFWENDLPQALEERLTDPDLRATAQFDYLVLDEAQ